MKLRFGLDLRRWCLDSEDELTLERVEEQVRSLFPVGDYFLVQFTDEEGELVTLASSSDLEEALRVRRAEGQRSLRLEVTPVDPTSRTRVDLGSESDWGVASMSGSASSATAPGAATGPREGSEDEMGFTLVHSARGAAEERGPDAQSPGTAPSAAADGDTEPERSSPTPSAPAAAAPSGEEPARGPGSDAAGLMAYSLRALAGADASSPAASSAFDDLLDALVRAEGAPLAALSDHPLLHHLHGKDSELRRAAIMCLVQPGTAQMVEQVLPCLARAPCCRGGGPTAVNVERALHALSGLDARPEGGGGGGGSPAAGEGAQRSGCDAIHASVSCDGCGVHPIVGVRFKCSECRDYDLCPACEGSGVHSEANHPLLKIVNPSQAPAMIITARRDTAPRPRPCTGRRGAHAQPAGRGVRRGGGPRSGGPVTRFLEQVASLLASRGEEAEHFERGAERGFSSRAGAPQRGEGAVAGVSLGAAGDGEEVPTSGPLRSGSEGAQPQLAGAFAALHEAATVAPAAGDGFSGGAAAGRAAHTARPRARFVSESGVMDGTPLSPGQHCAKSWTMANTGDVPWPEGTRLVHVGGDRLGTPASVPVAAATPGEHVDIGLEMEAPEAPGRYVSYWRLTMPDGGRFGHRVWVDVRVDQREVVPTEPAPEPTAPTAPAADAGEEEPSAPEHGPLAHLLQMGWPREDCERALRANGNDLQAAVLTLLE